MFLTLLKSYIQAFCLWFHLKTEATLIFNWVPRYVIFHILGKTFFCKNCIFWPRNIYLTFHQIGLDVPFSECLHQFWEGETFLFHFHSIINHCWSPLSFVILHDKIFCHTLLLSSRIYESTFAPVLHFFPYIVAF